MQNKKDKIVHCPQTSRIFLDPVICYVSRWLLCSWSPQYPLLQQRPGEQADADWGRRGSDCRRGPDRWGRSPTSCGQRRGGSHLQLLLLPLLPFSGLPLHHDDPHQLVQVSICCCPLQRDRPTFLHHWLLSDIVLGSSGPTHTTRSCRAPCRLFGWRSVPAGSDWPFTSGPWWPRWCSLTENSAKNSLSWRQSVNDILLLFAPQWDIALASNQSAWFS